MNFEKWQALGNDYLILERERLPFVLTAARVRRLCDSHFGVGADGILLLWPPDAAQRSPGGDETSEVVAELRIFNPDGSEAELSGNGAREAIMYLRRRGWTERDRFTIHTVAGPIRPEITGVDTCRVDIGQAAVVSKDFPGGPADGRGELAVDDGRSDGPGEWHFQHVAIGNPQCAIHVGDLATLQTLDLPAIGPGIEGHALFPNRTNVSWYTAIDSRPDDPPGASRIRARIFERGVGETLSSGTGATGAAVAHVLRSSAAPATVVVALDGGELLVEVGEDLRIHLTGWARPVFAGRLGEDFVQELSETE